MGWVYKESKPMEAMELETNFEATQERRDSIPNADDVYDQDEGIPITNLFDDTFVQSHSEFDSFDQMVAASPSTADCADELEQVSHREWDEFVAETTDFADERALVMAARDHWVAKRLNLD